MAISHLSLVSSVPPENTSAIVSSLHISLPDLHTRAFHHPIWSYHVFRFHCHDVSKNYISQVDFRLHCNQLCRFTGEFCPCSPDLMFTWLKGFTASKKTGRLKVVVTDIAWKKPWILDSVFTNCLKWISIVALKTSKLRISLICWKSKSH